MKLSLKSHIHVWRHALFALCLILAAYVIAPGFSSSAQAATGFGERTYWNNVKNLGDPALLRAYLKRYPHGKYVALAQAKLGHHKTPAHTKKLKHKVRNHPRAAKHHVAAHLHAKRKILRKPLPANALNTVPSEGSRGQSKGSGSGTGGGGGSSSGGGWQH